MEEDGEETTPLLNTKPPSEITTTTTQPDETHTETSGTRSVGTKVPEVELRVYRQGKGPIAVVKSNLGGWGQDQLEVGEILDEYGFKSIYAFSPPTSTRTVPIRFNPKNGRSLLPYKDGSIIYIDGEPNDSIKPITRIVVGVVLLTILIAVVATESPSLAEKFNLKGFRIPPWLLTFAVIVFTRMRKRTKDFLQKRGWF